MPVLSTAASFHANPLTMSYQQQLTTSGLWKPTCPVKLDRLRELTVSYYDFAGKPHDDGHIIVLDAVAKPVLQIFKRLYAMKFPLEKIKPTSDYGGDDDKSMADNNSSSFNCRPITGQPTGSLPSIHAYGLAIDINPVQNPYIGFDSNKPGIAKVLPAQGEHYLNRHHLRPGMAEAVNTIFNRHGFSIWGGLWNTPIDYQHFQPSRFVAKMLAHMQPQAAEKFFKITIKYPNVIAKFQTPDYQLIAPLYDQHPKQFNQIFQSQLPYANMHSIQKFIIHLKLKLNSPS